MEISFFDIPRDVFFDILTYLLPGDILSLNLLCRYLSSQVKNYMTRQIGQDVSFPLEWKLTKRYIYRESQTKIFPEMVVFLDMTTLLLRCLQRGDIIHYRYFCQQIKTKDEINISKLVSEILAQDNCVVKFKYLDELAFRLNQDKYPYILTHNITILPEGWNNLYLVTKFLSKYYESSFDGITLQQRNYRFEQNKAKIIRTIYHDNNGEYYERRYYSLQKISFDIYRETINGIVDIMSVVILTP